jgi:fused signal recognition particle receptor
VDQETLEQVEEVLISADFGLEFTDLIMDQLRARGKKAGTDCMKELRDIIHRYMAIPASETSQASSDGSPPAELVVYVVFGVNGTGKTTTVAKLARLLQNRGQRVLIAAADTYRDAAVEQLSVWARRASVPLIKQSQGSDPGAVVFDACDAALSRKANALLVDTAGRLHNKEQLMQELAKLGRVLDRKLPAHPKQKLLTIDATTGQNGISQAEQFNRFLGVHGIILTKLDSSSKGGIACAISGMLHIPILYAGTGEKLGDLEPFSVDDYLDTLFTVQ